MEPLFYKMILHIILKGGKEKQIEQTLAYISMYINLHSETKSTPMWT